MAREIVVGTSHKYNWVNLGAAINHPDEGKRLDISQDTSRVAGISDASVYMYPISGYGTPELVRQLMDMEKPDAIMFFTDPRYWIWLFQMENEIRKKVPMIYLNIWDDMPAPLYNKSYYESCDTLMAISKQTQNINIDIFSYVYIIIKMSNYKNGRMPKSKYTSLIENGCIKEKSCHKKQSTFISRFRHGLKYSRDSEGNVLCAGCKLLLIPKNVSDEVFGQYVSKIHKTGGCHNCC